MVLCTIWYPLYNLKNVKSTHGGVLLLVKLQAFNMQLSKRNTPPWMFVQMLPNCEKHRNENIHSDA